MELQLNYLGGILTFFFYVMMYHSLRGETKCQCSCKLPCSHVGSSISNLITRRLLTCNKCFLSTPQFIFYAFFILVLINFIQVSCQKACLINCFVITAKLSSIFMSEKLHSGLIFPIVTFPLQSFLFFSLRL